MKRPDLLAINLDPVGATVIDLLGGTTPERWTPWGSSYGTTFKDWTPAKGAAARALAIETECMLRRATKAQLAEYVARLGGRADASYDTKRSLVTKALNLINLRRYPREFINAKGGT